MTKLSPLEPEGISKFYISLAQLYADLLNDGFIQEDRAAFIQKVLAYWDAVQRQERIFTVEEWDLERAKVKERLWTAVEHIAGKESHWTN